MKVSLGLLLGGAGCMHAFQPPSRPFLRMLHEGGAADRVQEPPALWAGIRVMPRKAWGMLPIVLTGALTGWSPVQPTHAAEAYTSTTVASAFDAMCLGFGCGSYNGIDFAGQQVEAANGEPSISFQDFLKALDAKQVQKVELTGPNGDRAYASLLRPAADGESSSSPVVERLLIGEGYPIEASKAWSSPLWVVRILKDRGVPVTTAYDFSGVKTQAPRPPGKL